MDVQKLRDQRANIWEQAKALLDSGLDSAEKVQTYERMESDLDALDANIERAERAERREASYGRLVGVPSGIHSAPAAVDDVDDEHLNKVFAQFLRRGINALGSEDRALMESRFDTSIQNAAGVGSGAAGGYTVAPLFRDKFVETQKAFGVMLQEAEVIETDTGANLQWPTNDDTANVGAILAENTQVTEQDATFGTAALDAYMYTSKLVRASLQFLQDRPDADAWLARKLGERVGRILNNHFTVGTGTAQPDGIVTSATVGVTGTGSFASTGGISGDNLIDLTEALDPAYAAGELKFMMHQTARKAARKLKDSQGQYLWQPSLQAGIAATLAGYPVVVNNDMPTLAASSKSVIFGDIRQAYVIRIVRGLTVLRLVERYADYLQVGFLAFERADGTLQDGNAVRVFQTTATA